MYGLSQYLCMDALGRNTVTLSLPSLEAAGSRPMSNIGAIAAEIGKTMEWIWIRRLLDIKE
jgi:hypothetical protein